MQLVRINERTQALMCDRCTGVTFEMGAYYCPFCGAEVFTVVEPAEDVYAMAERYAYDVGFDEGYIAAMQEVEDYEGPSSGEGRGDDADAPD